MILEFSGLLRVGSCGLGLTEVIVYVSVDGETKRVSVRVSRPSESCRLQISRPLRSAQ